jgi:DNA modification methylase
MNIEQIKTSELIPYAKNAKLHSDSQISAIAGSIKEFGFNNPVLIDKDNGIIAGHGRVLAAQLLKLEHVPCIRLAHLSDTQKRAYILADNRLAETGGGWSEDLLKLELQDLQELDFDLSLTGFDGEFIADLNGGAEGLTDPDAVPEVPEAPTAKLGDIWQLGNHRLMCGDSTSIDDVSRLMIGVYPDLIHTDPPYGMNAVSKSSVLKANYGADIMGDDNPDVAKGAFNLIYSLYPNAKQIWWGANYYCSVLPDSECWLVWDKNNGQSDQTDCELAWANFRSVVRQFTQASEKINRVHPTQKPVSLMEWIIKRFNLSSKTIADYFGGSGSTLIAAEKNGLQAFIMEFDPKYCDVIVKRWEDFTGKKAVLLTNV